MKYARVLQFLVFMTAAFMAHGSYAAGINCNEATNELDKRICNDPELPKLDAQLNDIYKDSLKTLAEAKDENGERVDRSAVIDKFKAEQRNWIKYVRNICLDATCLKDAYQERINSIKLSGSYMSNKVECVTVPDEDKCVNVVYYRDSTEEMEFFKKSLAEHKTPGNIIGCSKLIDIAVGTASGNHSFGGYCTLKNGSERYDVRICADEMIGHFSLEKIDRKNISVKDLIDYTSLNCFGG